METLPVSSFALANGQQRRQWVMQLSMHYHAMCYEISLKEPSHILIVPDLADRLILHGTVRGNYESVQIASAVSTLALPLTASSANQSPAMIRCLRMSSRLSRLNSHVHHVGLDSTGSSRQR